MNSFTLLLACFLSCLIFTSPTLARLAPHKSQPKTDASNSSALERRTGDGGIYMPGETWQGLATSYDFNTDGKNGGACGYTQGGGLDMIPASIKGAAQKIGNFGNGLACGTCVKITPLDHSLPKHAPYEIVTVLNSCPGTCHSIDVESEVVTSWFGYRVGQLNMEAEVVPCGNLEQGIMIQYRQITNNPYDFRMGFRLTSGAIRLIEVYLVGTGWIPLQRVNPSQFTLVDQSKSHAVLSQWNFALRFTNMKGESVYQKPVPNLVGKGGIGQWYKTQVNFKWT